MTLKESATRWVWWIAAAFLGTAFVSAFGGYRPGSLIWIWSWAAGSIALLAFFVLLLSSFILTSKKGVVAGGLLVLGLMPVIVLISMYVAISVTEDGYGKILSPVGFSLWSLWLKTPIVFLCALLPWMESVSYRFVKQKQEAVGA